jgi:hypothetical protein
MTEQIGNHGLSCPSPTDYAAFALSMKCNAEAIDAALSDQGNAVGTFLGRPWQQAVNTSAMTIFDDASGGTFGPFNRVGSTIGNGSVTVTNNLIPFNVPLAPGIYLMGTSINWTLVTPTANSYRELSVFGVATINGETNIVSTFVDYVSAIDFQGDGGNNGALNVWGYLDTRSLTVPLVSAFFSHSNAASTLNVAAGQWRMWVMYMGSGLSI